MTQADQELRYFSDARRCCSYLPDQLATHIFVDPDLKKNPSLQTRLSERGFRRSGAELYHPYCETCNACIATRVVVQDFRANRNQQRCWRSNQDLDIKLSAANFEIEHFDLYLEYIEQRHAKGGMGNRESYLSIINNDWSQTMLMQFHSPQGLVAVAVIDRLDNGISAVYTFFDPKLKSRSLGRFAILAQIEYAQQQGLDWLYLGYLIKDDQKMRYKQDYLPQQRLINQVWQPIEKRPRST